MTKPYYNKNAKDFFEKTLNADMTGIYQRFEKYLHKGDHILDLGCGSGRDSLYFKNNGYIVTSVDYSEELVKLSTELLSQEVLQVDMREMDFYNEFEGIWACASILHIPKGEVKKVIQNCEKALKKNGVFYLSLKYGEGERYVEDRFFSYYNEEIFQDIIKFFINLKIIDMWTTIDVRKDREDIWLNIILKKSLVFE
ncbi:class I SAM-dependent methyltransferase [Inediibacterium massiliense]|uniref:class I SAM-dependent methyltransferase n=1 Tax=Inediibacterium massiliense TaxID=1658111 RepID=UPI0006B49C04|nr:class I SAM-dependent methyltransferase [Inediibacterium massiliense]